MKVGLIQTRTPVSQEAALAHVLPMVREAAARGAVLIVTPEGTNILQRDRPSLARALRTADEDVVVQGLREAARELGIWLLIGSALVRLQDGKAANRAFLLSPQGEITATYDKMHMFDVDLPTGERSRESESYEAGSKAVVAPAGEAMLGLTICYDLRFPALYRALALAGANVLTVPSAFTRPTGEAHWEVLLRARAIETGSYVLAPAQGGLHEDGRQTWGHSMVVGPWGRAIGHLDHDRPGVLLAALELPASAKARQAIPALLNARDFTPP